jgi:Asp-tRNA(Asn)/Glu-tRNA(Gln) amidotransferase A subunit family amidase
MTERLPTEATVAEIHDAIRDGSLTSVELVDQYLDRIAAYDRAGPELNAIVTVNPRARERAAELDADFGSSGFVGPLHGIPILLKDQIQTAGLRTTFGSAAFADYVPDRDATLVTALRDAGAIILAKTNMPDWAAGFVGYSSVQGQTKNPYGLDRDSGGSSAGTGAGIAANLGAIGIGEDTGGSIRVPASCCNLFGLRVTTGLVSRSGLSPLVERMDTPGPMTRTVEDMARVLDVIVGFDPEDERTATAEIAPAAGSYRDALDPDALDGARIGVLRERFGDGDTAARDVNECVENALNSMASAGAQLVDITVPDLDRHLTETSLHAVAPKHDIDAFLAELDDPPVSSVEDLYQSGTYHEALELFETIAAAPADPTTDSTYWERVAGQARFREALVASLAGEELDAIAFPDVQVPPPVHEALRAGDVRRADYPVNTTIASQSGCPAISVPAGFTDDGLPVGMELLGRPYAESRLLGLAFAFEQVTDHRKPPATTPALSETPTRESSESDANAGHNQT